MDAVINVIQSLGFPIACVIGLGWFLWRFVERIMDENKSREEKYQEMVSENNSALAEYGRNLTTITATLERMELRMESCENKIIEIKNNQKP